MGFLYSDNLEYAKKRLEQTLVRTINGHLFFVKEVSCHRDGQFFCEGRDIILDENLSVSADDIDMMPIPLGNINTSDGRILFTSRKPMRKDWKQGLSANSISVQGGLGFPKISLFKQPVYNQYPSFEKCLSVMKAGKKEEYAFSRNFAIRRVGENLNVVFQYKHCVGQVLDDKPCLSREKFFLQEHLDQELNMRRG